MYLFNQCECLDNFDNLIQVTSLFRESEVISILMLNQVISGNLQVRRQQLANNPISFLSESNNDVLALFIYLFMIGLGVIPQCLGIQILHSSLIESYSEHLGILFGDFGTDYPNTERFGHLILSTMSLYSTWQISL